MIKFFCFCFLVLPWVIIPNDKLADPFRLPKAVFFDLICLGLICFSLKGGLKKRYFNKYLCWWTGWVFFTIFMGFYLPYSLSFNNRIAVNVLILEPMLHFFLGLWASYIVLSSFEKEDYLKISKIICISAILISAVGVGQALGLDIFGKIAKYNHPNKVCAFLDNPNIVGNYLCLTLPFFLLKENFRYILGIFLVVITIILTQSELSLGCAFIGFIACILLNYRKRIIYTAAAVFVLLSTSLLFLHPSILTDCMSGRITVWKMSWEKFKINPYFGQGLGVFKSFGIIHNNTRVLAAHNDWLEIAIMLGAVGLVLLIIVIFNSFKKFNYEKENKIGFSFLSSFIAFLFLMTASFPITIAPLILFGLVNWWAVEIL